jgi:hypothetical protein
MALFILDEWLWSDAAGENGKDRQRETLELILAVYEICDRIVVVRGSKFDEKAASFWRHTDTTRRQFARFFKESILYNSVKAELVEPENLNALPEPVIRETQPKDRYLVQAQRTMPDSIVITTDTNLKAALDHNGIPCKHRDAFVSEYLLAYRKRKLK